MEIKLQYLINISTKKIEIKFLYLINISTKRTEKIEIKFI